jgi:hypothetical protein
MFTAAIKCYELDVKSRNKKNQERALKRLADCYRITGKFELAEDMYRKIIKKYRKDAANYLNYGLSLKSSAKYAEAALQFQEYIRMNPNDPMGDFYIASCDSAQKWLDETLGQDVMNVLSINTEKSDFSPVLLPNRKLMFCSSRSGSKQAFISLDGGNEQSRLDLYTVDLDELKTSLNSKSPLHNLHALNTPSHEGPACISPDGKELYFTKTVKGHKNKEQNSILSTLQVFVSFMEENGNWSEPKSAFDFNSDGYSVAHPAISPDGKTIFFMSDKPGGKGKTDIYYARRTATGKWGAAINAGDYVNTFGYELFPYISADNELYFSSNVHPGMGQLDIFKSVLFRGKWQRPQNLRPPFNSIGNDFGMCIDPPTGYGFFSSDRLNGKGAEDLYAFAIDRPVSVEIHQDTLLFPNLQIFDAVTYALENETTATPIELQLFAGNYFAILQPNNNYKLNAKKHGLKIAELDFQYKLLHQPQDYELTASCQKNQIIVSGYYNLNPTFASIKKSPSVGTKRKEEVLTESISKEGLFQFSMQLDPSQTKTISSSDPRKCCH